MVLNDSSVLNKSVLQSKAALSRIIATVSCSYCLPPLTRSYLKRNRWRNTINLDRCLTKLVPEKKFYRSKIMASLIVASFFFSLQLQKALTA